MTPEPVAELMRAVSAIVRRAEADEDVAVASAALKARVIAFLDAGGYAILVACRKCEIKYPLASEDRALEGRLGDVACLGCGRVGYLRQDKRASAWRAIQKHEAENAKARKAGREP